MTVVSVTAGRIDDDAGEPMWTVSAVVGLEGAFVADDRFVIRPCPRESSDAPMAGRS